MKIAEPFVKSFLQNGEALFNWLASNSLGVDLPSYCQLETALGLDPDSPRTKKMAAEDPAGARPYVLVTRKSSLVTVFKLTGCLDIVGDDEFEEITTSLRAALTSYFQRPGHSIELSFERDPEQSLPKVRELMNPSYETARRIGLDFEDILDARVERVAALCSQESSYVVMFTHLSALSPEELKREMKTHMESLKLHKVQPMLFAQSVTSIVKGLVNAHDTFVDALEKDFGFAKLHVTRLSTHEAANMVRGSFDRKRTSRNWKPELPGDRYIPTEIRGSDTSGYFMPKLSEQICPSKIEIEGEYVKINGQYHGTAYMYRGPQELTDFNTLFERVDKDTPWRIKFSIAPGGVESQKFKAAAISIVGFMGDNNKAIKRSFDAIDDARKKGATHVTLRIGVSTWGDDKDTCSRRLDSLVRALQGWGTTQISTDTGDPVKGLACSVPAFTDEGLGAAMIPPLSDVVRLFPFRAASPWHAGGSILLRTLDGQIYPMQPQSSLQTAWIDLIWALMGSGKSVWLNCLNLGAILSPGLLKLMLTTIIDVGPSSSGLIDLLRSALPPDRVDEAIYIRLRNELKFAINPCDTLPGCRFPTAFGREYLTSLITALATPVGKGKDPYDQAAELAGMLVDEVYTKFAEPGTQKPYEPTIEPSIDEALAKMDFVYRDGKTSWWDVTDLLQAAGHKKLSRLAQRYAVPVLSDFSEALGSDRVRSIFAPSETSRVMTSAGMSLLDMMRIVFQSALRDYPVISSHTRFEISDQARVIALDLEEVTKGGGDDSEKRAEIMFTFARQIAASRYYLPKTIEDIAPEIYHAEHAARYAESKEEMKALCIDELHRTGGKKSFRKLLSLDRREGRKHGIRVSLASQFMQDFESDGESIADSAFSVYIMNAGTQKSRTAAQELFGFPDSALAALKRDVRGAGKFLVWHQTKAGNVTQILHNAPSPIELWAFSTSAKDVGLRRRLYERMRPSLARRLLALEFPTGSASDYMELRQKEQVGNNDTSIIDIVADELMMKYNQEIVRDRVQ